MLPRIEVKDPSGSTYVRNKEGQWTVKKAGAASAMRVGEMVAPNTNLSRYLDSMEKKQNRRTFTSKVAGAVSDITSGRGTVAGAKGRSTTTKTGASIGRLSGRALGSALDRVYTRMQQSKKNKPLPPQAQNKIRKFVPKMLKDRKKALQFIELMDEIAQRGYNTSQFGGALWSARDIVSAANEGVISESGSLPDAGSIHKSEIAPTLDYLGKELGVDLKKNILGSAGKKEFSGDIDVAIDIEESDIPAFIEKLEQIPGVTDVTKGSVIMTKVKIQNYQPEEKTDRPRTGYVQMDFMIGDPDWLKVYYFSPSETESRYKGVFRNIMISSIAGELDKNASPERIPDGRPVSVERYMWSPTNGLVRVRRTPQPSKDGSGYNKKNNNEIIGGPWKKPNEIVKVLKLDTPADLRSYESLTRAIKKNYPAETVIKILSAFARNSTVQDMGVPPELKEFHGGVNEARGNHGGIILEAAPPKIGRIQHAEDIVFWEGSYGARRVVQALEDVSKGAYRSVSLKWDGSPAAIFGRDENGYFVFTDKSGFIAKKYDGRVKSPEHMKKMLLTRGNRDRSKDPKYRNFVRNMMRAYELFERSVPKDFRGYVKGDMLYFNTPELVNGNYVFTPNVVTYQVNPSSDLGSKIASSEMGIVLHRSVDSQGNETPLNRDIGQIIVGTQILAVPPVHPQSPPNINSNNFDKMKAFINKYSADIDELLNEEKLRENKISDLSNLFYTYINSKVDTGLENLGQDFLDWVKTANISNVKKLRIPGYINDNIVGFNALWKVVKGIMLLKNQMIQQLDTQQLSVQQSISGTPGGEGYVIAHTGGDIKLVSRNFFSKANRATKR